MFCNDPKNHLDGEVRVAEVCIITWLGLNVETTKRGTGGKRQAETKENRNGGHFGILKLRD